MMIVAGTHPVRSGVREALRRLSDPRLDRGHEPTPALPRRPPPGQRGPLSDHRPHALAPTDDRLRQGLSDIIRCLKRFVAREIFNALIIDHRSRAVLTGAASSHITTLDI